MTGDTSERTEAADDCSVADPTAYAAQHGIEVGAATLDHEDLNYCERDVAGLAVVGVTDADGRALAAIEPDEGHAMPLNEPVADDEDWATVAREGVEGVTGAEPSGAFELASNPSRQLTAVFEQYRLRVRGMGANPFCANPPEAGTT